MQRDHHHLTCENTAGGRGGGGIGGAILEKNPSHDDLVARR